MGKKEKRQRARGSRTLVLGCNIRLFGLGLVVAVGPSGPMLCFVVVVAPDDGAPYGPLPAQYRKSAGLPKC